jgi:hypothetical protein
VDKRVAVLVNRSWNTHLTGTETLIILLDGEACCHEQNFALIAVMIAEENETLLVFRSPLLGGCATAGLVAPVRKGHELRLLDLLGLVKDGCVWHFTP